MNAGSDPIFQVGLGKSNLLNTSGCINLQPVEVLKDLQNCRQMQYEVAQDSKRIDRQMYVQHIRKNQKKIKLLRTKEELIPKNLMIS